MEEKRTGLFENGLIWFGAGVSIAEILTGTYLAPLGMGKGDCKDELWTERKCSVCGPECVAACRLDCDHDL